MAEGHKLLHDLRDVPSWIWLGGAAGIGLLWILRGQSAASSAAQPVVAPAPAPTGTTGTPDTGTTTPPPDLSGITSQLTSMQTELSWLEQQVQIPRQPQPIRPTPPSNTGGTGTDSGLAALEAQILAILQLMQKNSTGSTGTTPTGANNTAYQTPGQAPGYTPPTGVGAGPNGFPGFQQPGLGSTNWAIVKEPGGNIFGINLANQNQVYQLLSSGWQSMTNQQYQAWVNSHPGGVTSMGYIGAGNYYGKPVPALPSPNPLPTTPSN